MKVRTCGRPVYGEAAAGSDSAGGRGKVSGDHHGGSRGASSEREESLTGAREEGPIRRLTSLPGPYRRSKRNRKGQEEIRFETRRHFRPSAKTKRKRLSQQQPLAPQTPLRAGFQD